MKKAVILRRPHSLSLYMVRKNTIVSSGMFPSVFYGTGGDLYFPVTHNDIQPGALLPLRPLLI